MLRYRLLFVWLCTATLTFALAGCLFVPDRSATGPELIEPVKLDVDVVEVKRGTLSFELNNAGVVIPTKTDYLFFEIDGKLGEAAVMQGDRVKKGQVLLRLDSGNFKLELAQQQLAIENMQDVLAKYSDLGNTEEIKIAQMNLEIERMKLERMLDRESKRVLVSPIDGIVTFMEDIRAGSSISSFREVIGITHTEPLQISYVGELSAYARYIEIGMEVNLQYEGLPAKGILAGAPWTAPIDLYPHRADILGRTLLFDFADKIPHGITIGDHVEFKLVLAQKQDVLIIPRGALRMYQGRNYVLLAEGETLRETDVQPGLITQTEVEIIAGLVEGQKVVVNQ